MHLLGTSCNFLVIFLGTFYAFLINFLINLFHTSNKCLANILRSSYELLKNFLQTNYKQITNKLQISLKLYENFFINLISFNYSFLLFIQSNFNDKFFIIGFGEYQPIFHVYIWELQHCHLLLELHFCKQLRYW